MIRGMDNTAQFDPQFVAGVKLIVMFLKEHNYQSAAGAVFHDGHIYKVTVEELDESKEDEHERTEA